MHKWAESILECVKAKAEGIGIENFEGQNLDDLKDWTEIVKNIVCFDKDYKIVEAMKKAEENEEIMEMIERYEGYPERRYYDSYRYANGRFAPKGRGTRRGYDEPPYWHQTPEMYHDWDSMSDMERMRDLDRHKGRMYYTEPMQGQRISGEMDSSNMRNPREGRSGMSRKTYMDTKDMHKGTSQQDKEAKLRDLEKYMRDFSEDMSEILIDTSPEEKNMVKTKLSTLITKI